MARRRCSPCIWLPIVLLVLVAGSCVLQHALTGTPEKYTNDEAHFKYGSIGSDNLRRGIPYRIFKALPVIFDNLLNDPSLLPTSHRKGYARLGIFEEDEAKQPAPNGSRVVQSPRPIGFSKRWIMGLDVVGINCSFCHVATLRVTPTSPPSPPILRMPANELYAEAFFRFLIRVGKDPRFTSERLLAEMIKQDPDMPWHQRLLYQQLFIPLAKVALTNLGRHLAFLEETGRARFGPGRVETWAIYKILTLQHSFALIDLLPDLWSSAEDMDPRPGLGFADFPALWPIKPRLGPYHWDGNNPSLGQRNTTAGMGAGITPPSRDEEGLARVAKWIERGPPRYNDDAPPEHQVKEELANQGKKIYDQRCASCHELPKDGKESMGVTPIECVRTDRARLDSFTRELTVKLKTVGRGYSWRLDQYEKTKGYANMTLSGIWLRAPYLHNGSVPTLKDLLSKVADRPSSFYRGDAVYDWKNVGFRSTVEKEGKHEFFHYKTGDDGNGNGGHDGPDYGTELSPEEKGDLLEYLKTL